MDKNDLPDEFAHLTAYDMGVNGFEQEFVRGIKKLIPLPVMLLEQRKRRRKALKKVGLVAMVCAIIGVIIYIPWFAKLPDYNAAMQLYYDKNYPEATWAFDKLGSYRRSKEMKYKCERSWRKSLANVIICTNDGAATDSTYYIDNNGSLQREGSSKIVGDLKPNEHGKVVSLASNENIYNVIYEDGFVSNVAENAKTKEKWNNVIQIAGFFADTTVALRTDGTMVYDAITEGRESYGNTNDWMKPMENWSGIVEISSVAGSAVYGNACWGYNFAAIIGLKADGTTVSVVFDDGTASWSESMISGAMSRLLDNNRASSVDNNAEKEEYNIVEANATYALTDEAILIDVNSNLPILRDIIHIVDNYAISRNENVYLINYNGDSKKIDNMKVPVYDEWMERMK